MECKEGVEEERNLRQHSLKIFVFQLLTKAELAVENGLLLVLYSREGVIIRDGWMCVE